MTSLADRHELIAHLDELLDAAGFDDYGPNGLQVPGREGISKVVTAVSAHAETIARAREHGAELLLVHHGLLWDFHPRALTPVLAERLRGLLVDRINLVQYHLPLDAHPVHGNNALLADAFGCEGHEAFGRHRGRAIGRLGRFPDGGIGIGDLIERVTSVCDREPLAFPFGPEQVRTIAIVSGAAATSLPAAVALDCDAFLTGEPAEHVMADAKEAGIHFLAAGHYATETLGIRRLGDLLADRFGIEHVYVDVPNPI